MSKRVFSLLIMIVLIISIDKSFCEDIKIETEKESAATRLVKFKQELEKKGFIVQEGKMERIDFIELYCAGIIPDSYLNNTNSLYMGLNIPPAPGTTQIAPLPWLYQLDKDEAVIIVGKTPPPVKYFSYQSFMQQRYFAAENKYKRIGSLIGDTINNLTIKTQGSSKDPYNKSIVLISTADEKISNLAASAAKKAGFSRRCINTEVMCSSFLNMGNQRGSDLFILGHRLYLPKAGYEQAVQDYLNTPQVVLRITPAEKFEKLKPYPAPKLRVRGTGTTEMDLLPAVNELRAAILNKYAGYEATELSTRVWFFEGYDGIQRNFDTLSFTRDALYLRTEPDFHLGDNADDFVIVYGVNHEQTKKATYSNFVLNISETAMMGIESSSSPDFPGSADQYIPGHPQAGKLYAWKITRRGNGEPYCTEIKPVDCDRLVFDETTDCYMGFRLYVEPKTKVGPAFTEILYDRAIKFTKTPVPGKVRDANYAN